MHSPTTVVRAFGGIARRDQILATGCSGTDITAAVRRGEITRVRRAHYAGAEAHAAGRIAVRVGGRLGGPSAAATYGVWAGFDERVHIVVAPNASRLRWDRSAHPPTGDIGAVPIIVHWEHFSAGRECWRVPLEDALRQTAAWCDDETALAALDTAVDSRLISMQRLYEVFRHCSARERALAEAARPGSGSGYESIAARRFEAAGLRVRQQVVVHGVGRIDGQLEDELFYEIDGDRHHRSRSQREADRRRDSALVARGHAVIRFGAPRVRDDWAGCLAEAVEALRHRIPRRRFQEISRRIARARTGETRSHVVLLKTERGMLKTECDTPS